ncbi:hypothetical protein W97_00583 [Coniosporium apollinis CBS 100218]|uniref:ethanolamine kinase n=1 Tax=Coniosporium apollinis (strain CBS 100218) TaxID=1168221 RepID=R7YHT4_CONA1|nr:uncharacterized protein W97_00583 [Coniosporium apollinis CBS 100218]EON61369.1 hypothetical protein W97_00583 [Coniosporium apollinis CBS 100218]
MDPSSDPPSPLRHIPLCYGNADSEASALRLVLALEPSWTQHQDCIEFIKFTDGITNTLLKAVNKRAGQSQECIDQEAIMLRAYGEGTAVLIDRERERLSHSLLASHGLAPPLLASFHNGLLYKFIPGEVCSPSDLRRPEIWRGVARRLAEWHATLPISSISSEPAVEAQNGIANGHRRSDSPVPMAQQKRGPGTSDRTQTEEVSARKILPNLWTVMQRWISALPAGSEAERKRQAMLRTELTWLARRLADTPGIGGKPLVFAHCDLLSGNVIIEPTTSPESSSASLSSQQTNGSDDAPTPVSFIDYEYATPAPAAFDLANHFAEWGGFDCDFSVLPTRSQRRDFLQAYLVSFNQHLDRPYREEELEQLFQDVDAFRGVPGFYWGIWALIQATISHIDFDYASYAEVRLGEYWAWKESLEKRAVNGKEKPLRERRWAEE